MWLLASTLGLTFAVFSILSLKRRNRKTCLNGKHVMVTGGSSGIGKHLAIESVKLGANVSILARDSHKLDQAKAEILKHAVDGQQKVVCVSVDVSDTFENVEKAFKEAEAQLGPVFLLANNAGYCRAAKFEEMPVEQFKHMMEVNYFGSVQVTRCSVISMKEQKQGHILFISSDAAFSGIFGFTSYSATKFALRGFAESLAMELKPFNIAVTVSFPPDTDTPGFVEENRDKPLETRLISECAGLQTAQNVAHTAIQDTLRGAFVSSIGVEGFAQSIVCAGMSPVTSGFRLLLEVLFMGPLRLVSAFYLRKFDSIVRKGATGAN